MNASLAHYSPSATAEVRLASFDDLSNGIWPRSFAVWVLAFWMALLVIRPWEKLMPELAAFRVERVYAIFAISVVLLSGRARLDNSFQTNGLILWGLALSISAAFSLDSTASWDLLYVYYTLFVFYFALLCTIRTPGELLFIITSFVAVVAVYLAKSQWEHFVHGSYSFSMGVRRLRGIDVAYSHPNAVACTAVLTLPLIGYLWHNRGLVAARWPRLWQKLLPWSLAVSFWLVLSSVMLTNSRSGQLGIVVAACLWTIGQDGVAKLVIRLLLAGLLLAVLWNLMPENSRGRFRNIWDPNAGPDAESAHVSAEGRIEGLKQGIEMFRRYPATGVGLGNFSSYRIVHLDGSYLVAHNMIGAVLGETGMLGGVALVVFVSGVFVNCSRAKRVHLNCRTSQVALMTNLAIACRNSIILILFFGMFGDQQGRAQLYWIAAFCGLAYTFARSAAQRPLPWDDETLKPSTMRSRQRVVRMQTPEPI